MRPQFTKCSLPRCSSKPATEILFEIGNLPEAVSHVQYGSWKVFTLARPVRMVYRTDLSMVLGNGIELKCETED
jgi:hypothetical protein